MTTLLIRNATVVATMDDQRREIADGAIFARDGVIEQVGTTADLPDAADEVIDASDHVVIPGLINTHHHMVQNLTRAVPAAQDVSLFGWLTSLYPIWSRLTPEHVKSAVTIALAEMALSGCTTSSDHQYLWPGGSRIDDEIEAAAAVGVRFTAARGSMSIGVSKGGLPPDHLIEREEDILKDCERVVDRYHDPRRHSMLHVALAPCSPFTVSLGLFRETAQLARAKGVRLHTHLAENVEDIDYGMKHIGKRPGDMIEELGWTGADVWHAHCVQLNDAEIALFGRTGTGIAHCPCSNMRLASGIAPLGKMLAAKVPVGIGVDGSASNDRANLLNEARQAMLLQRVNRGANALSARQALELATRGSARVLGRDDIGHLAAGMSADLALYDLNTIELAGGGWDPVAALLFCGPPRAATVIVQGKAVVRQSQITTIDLRKAIETHRMLARNLANG